MRNLSLFAFLALSIVSATACSPSDNTANREDTTPHDANYPVGPYGYKQGSTVFDYRFLGKVPTDGDYVNQPLADLYLGAYHSDPAVKYVLIEGSANWCPFCNQEAPNIEKLATDHAADGFRALTVLAEGATRGVPAQDGDITAWTTIHDFKKSDMAIDPESRLFQYADAAAFPLHILVETTGMTIQWLCVGGIGACDSEQAVTAALAQ